MARRAADDIDLLATEWARVRRQLLGLTRPLTHREYIGAIRCTLARVRDHRDGAGAFTASHQKFPEVYTGDSLLFNLAYKRLPPELRDVIEVQYLVTAPAADKADALAVSVPTFYSRLAAAKGFVRGYMGALADRAA